MVVEIGIKMGIDINELYWQPEKDGKGILNGINVKIEKGKFYGILGPNGSGKTSFIRHILRLLSVYKGEILVEDKDIDDYNRKELATILSFVPQNTNLDAAFTVYDIVMMGRAPHQGKFAGVTKEDREIVEEAMRFTKCDKFRNKSFLNLSGGEAQRVVTARAIAQQTPYLILDEPISHLDIRYQMELMQCLKKLNEERGTTIIAVLHDLNLAYSYCKEIFLMKDGKIFASGDRMDVLTRENLHEVYEMDFTIVKHPDTNENYYIPKLEQ